MFHKKKKEEVNTPPAFDFASYYNSSGYKPSNNYSSNQNNNTNNFYDNNLQKNGLNNNYNPYGNNASYNFNQYNNGSSQNTKEDDNKKIKFIIKIGVIVLSAIVFITVIIILLSKLLTKDLIVLDNKEITLGVNNKKRITYQLTNSDTPVEVSFKSENTDIVTVDENGYIETIKEGEAAIIVSYTENGNTKNLKCKIIVTKGEYPSCTLAYNDGVVTASVSNAKSYGFNNQYNQEKQYNLENPTTKDEAGEKIYELEYDAKNDDDVIGFCKITIKRNCTCTYFGSDNKCYKTFLRKFPIYNTIGGSKIPSYCSTSQYQDQRYCYFYSDEGMDCTFSTN